LESHRKPWKLPCYVPRDCESLSLTQIDCTLDKTSQWPTFHQVMVFSDVRPLLRISFQTPMNCSSTWDILHVPIVIRLGLLSQCLPRQAKLFPYDCTYKSDLYVRSLRAMEIPSFPEITCSLCQKYAYKIDILIQSSSMNLKFMQEGA
jgi:hypothetical protein